MTDPTTETAEKWFECINVGDDGEEKDDRRRDDDLTIPGYSVVEVVGNRIVNGDEFVYEVRLNRPNTNRSITADENYTPSGSGQAFTFPADIPKGQRGRFQFAPAYVRFDGTLEDTKKIFGKYEAPARVRGGKYTNAEHDEFERLEEHFGQGNRAQLFGSPSGALKLKPYNDNTSLLFEQGWDVLGVVKSKTGERSKNDAGQLVFEDDDPTKNLLVMVTPAAPAPPPSVIFLTKEDTTSEVFKTGRISVDFLEYIDPRSAGWNHKILLDFAGVYGNEYQFEIRDPFGTFLGPFYITTDGSDIKSALEAQDWCGVGNVRVQSPGRYTGRFIIEFIKKLAGVRLGTFYWRRIINISTPPENLLGGAPEIPPITLQEIFEYDYRILPGTHSVDITPASRPLTRSQLFYGDGYWYGNSYYGAGGYAGWNYGYGYYGAGPYGYYGGWGGGPFGYLGGGYYGAEYGYTYGGGYYGPNGFNAAFYTGPYDFDATGAASPGGGYNSSGYNSNGYNADGYDPAGFDGNGLNAAGEYWGYYGVWGHLHTSNPAHEFSHKNDHGIIAYNATNPIQYTAAGSFGVASWSQGGNYVVSEIEKREFWLDVQQVAYSRLTTYY